MERATRQFKTSFGSEVTVKEFLTERENRQLMETLSGSITINAEGKAESSANTGTFLKYQDEMVNLWLMKLNGYTEGIINLFLELPRARNQAISSHLALPEKKWP